MTAYRLSRSCPGPTWQRRGIVWRGHDGVAYLWRRSAWRMVAWWVALAAVVGWIGWGVGR